MQREPTQIGSLSSLFALFFGEISSISNLGSDIFGISAAISAEDRMKNLIDFYHKKMKKAILLRYVFKEKNINELVLSSTCIFLVSMKDSVR